MPKRIRATEAVRTFSDLLNTIKFRGEHYTIVRGGKPIAQIGPVEALQDDKKLRDLKVVLDALPPLGEEAERFSRDAVELVRRQPFLPKEK